MKFFDFIDLSELELKNFLVHNSATSDVTKKAGRMVYNSSTLYYSDTTNWYTIAKTSDINLNNLGIGSVTGGVGFLKRSSAGAWSFDNSTYALSSSLTSHTGDTTIHITAAERSAWNAKYDKPSGGIPNTDLANSSITIGSTAISLGSSSTTLAGLTSVTSTSFVGELTGNASSATKLKTSRNLWGNSFDGTSAISGALTFTAASSASATAHLEVITVNGVTYLHTRLPFYSDSSVSAGGISTTSGGTGGTNAEMTVANNLATLWVGDETNKAVLTTKKYVDDAITASFTEQDAMRYMGVIAGGSTGSYGALTPAANKGDTYKASAAGKIDGVSVEVGDMLICNTDGTAAATSSNYSTIAGKWDIIQTNLTNYVTTFGGATGAITIDNSTTTNGAVKFAMSSNKLTATVYGLGSFAYKSSLAYDDLSTKPTSAQIQALVGNYVTTFGTKTGAITVRGGLTANGSVNLTMYNNELQASIEGLGSAAYTASTAYATAAQGTKADNAFAASSFTATNIVNTLGTSAVNRATADASGNTITTTYATKTQLTDGSVTKVGTSTVGGATTPIYLSSGAPTACTMTGDADAGSTTIARRYQKKITGNGTATSFDITHSLGNRRVLVSVFDASYEMVFVDTTLKDANNVTVTFAKAPTSSESYYVVVVG